MMTNYTTKSLNKGMLLVLFLLINLTLPAQQANIIRGKVTNESGAPMPFCTIVEINENNRAIRGVVSDANGMFSTKVMSRKNRLKFSFIGYKTKLVEVGNQDQINVQIVPDNNDIKSVDITARKIRKSEDGALTIRKDEMTSSSVRMELDEMSEIAAVSVAEVMEGQLSGIDISYPSGNPGEGLQIEVRGNTSLFGQSTPPLIVIDGVPYTPPGVNDFDFADGDGDDYATLLDIPVEDIMSIEVMKDALSASIYGEDGANGVIMVKTRRGEVGKPKVSYKYAATFNAEPDPIEVLNGPEYVNLMLEAEFNKTGLGIEMPSALAYDPDYKYYHEYAQDVDWLDAVTRNTFQQSHSVSVSGGGEMAKYRLSTSYLNQPGTTLGTAYERLSLRLNLDYDISTKTRLAYDFSYSNGDKLSNYTSTLRSIAYKKSPNMSIYEYDEQGNATETYFTPDNTNNYQGTMNTWYNPVSMANEAYKQKTTNALRTSLTLISKLGNGISFRSYVVLTSNTNETRGWVSQEAYGSDYSSNLTNKSSYNSGKAINVQHRSTLTFNKSFGAGKLGEFLGGGKDGRQTFQTAFLYNVVSKNSYSSSGTGTNGATTEVPNYFAGNINASMKSGSSEYRSANFTTTGHYNLLNKYMLRYSMKYNGNSKLSDESRWKFLWGVGGAWNFSRENWLKDSSWLRYGKLRYSFAYNSNFPSSSYYGTFSESVDYGDISSTKPNNLQLDQLTYETTLQYDLGLELTIGKLNLEADYYLKTTDDKIVSNFAIPSNTGFSTVSKANFGAVRNQGYELAMSYPLIKMRNHQLKGRFNVSFNKNRLTKLPEGYSKEDGNMDNNGEYYRMLETNKPTGGFYGYRSLGVFAKDEDAYLKDDKGATIYDADAMPRRLTAGNGYEFRGGDAHYLDMNRDGVIDEQDIEYLGNSRPLFYGGFGLNYKYKTFTLSAGFSYNIGKDIMNGTRMTLEKMNSKANQAVSVLRRWRKPGDVTDIPRATFASDARNYLGSDRFIESADFIRLNNLSLSYQLPKRYRMGFRSFKLSCNVRNLFTWTDYKGQNPNVGSNSSSSWSSVGKDNSTTPPARSVSFTLNVGF